MANLYYVPQYKTTTLSVAGGINSSQTTGIVLSSIPADVDTTKPGVVCISWSDPISTDDAEWVTYTSINAIKELQGVTRGQEGYSAKAHLNGATVAWTISKSHINNMANALKTVYNESTGTLLKATGAEVDTGTEDAKIVTPKAIADSTRLPNGKATGTDVDTGTNDVKFVTPKAIADSNVVITDKTQTLSNKTLTSPLFQGTLDGWILANETWTYASSTTITVPSGATSKYQKGDKIRLKQGGGYKYFYIVNVADTLLTVTGGSDYSVANASITDNYYSKVSNPFGFPHWFNYTPTLTNLTLGSGELNFKFKINSFNVFVRGYFKYISSSVSGLIGFSLPIGIASHESGRTFHCTITDAGTSYMVGYARLSTERVDILASVLFGSYVGITDTSSSIPMVWANNDTIHLLVTYNF